MIEINYSQNLQEKILTYYLKYYKLCGLSDFKERAEERLKEEEVEEKRIGQLKSIFSWDLNGKKHLIVGAGTGGLAVVLKQEYSGEVFGIEPSEEGFEIIKGKCQEKGLDFSNFKKEFAEKISFENNYFDFVYCITVLEHVQDVKQSIEEMLRVLKPGGFLFIDMPNRLFPIEKHYKIIFPTFLPKIFGKAYLFFRKKPIALIKSIHFFTEKKINKILARQSDITWVRIYQSNYMSDKSGIRGLLLKILIKKLFIYPTQEIIIQKGKLK